MQGKVPSISTLLLFICKRTISFKALTCFQSPKSFRLKTHGFVSNKKAPTMTWTCYVHIIWTIWLWQCSQQRLSGAILSFLGVNMLVECKNMQEYAPITFQIPEKRQGIDQNFCRPIEERAKLPLKRQVKRAKRRLRQPMTLRSGVQEHAVHGKSPCESSDESYVVSGQEPEEESESELEEDSSSLQWLCLTWRTVTKVNS